MMNEPGFALTACCTFVRGVPVFVSTEDADLAWRSWYRNNGYARGMGDRYMHRIVAERCGLTSRTIDHANGDAYDNRRCNLRAATPAENARNQTRKGRHHSSRFKGVYWAAWANRWRAEITVNRKAVKLGYFDTEREAQDAYAAAATELFGDFAAPRVEATKP